MAKVRYELEKPSLARDILITFAIGAVAVVVIEHLFSGMAVFLEFIVAAILIYFFVRR